jgi:predicted acetyltransferase
MGGIGEVSTKEEYRGKGLASSLLSVRIYNYTHISYCKDSARVKQINL